MPNMKLFPSLSPLSTLPKSGGRPRNGQLEVSTSSQEAPRNQEPGYHSRPLHLPRVSRLYSEFD
ncbi:BnaC04g42680D [Brassica napus]|uniref:BnaC04g42680D protein n=1 Tax=Brassica napus TaxID=3708 RepID=A0A078FLP4_BRANA|nr:BnaC04g42680D [Brassica napus]